MRRNNSVAWRRANELGAMTMIGDGVLAVLEPRRHARLWADGPKPWRKAMRPFVRKPGLTRALGALEVGFGVWLASRQRP